jgi:excisionase family DNA binding protein
MVERLLTPEEAANRLGIAPRTLREWLRSGKLPGVKLGRLWRIRETDLKAFIAKRERHIEPALCPS